MSKSTFNRVIPAAIAVAALAGSAMAMPTWTVAYDQTGVPSSGGTHGMRSVAVGNNSVYFGFIQSSPNRNVYRHDWDAPYGFMNNRGANSGDQPKAIATDDRGNVFIGNRVSGTQTTIVKVHDAALTEQHSFNFSTNEFGGVAVAKHGSDYFLYVSREAGRQINRYNINDVSNITLDVSFGTGGTYTLPMANSSSGVLRGLWVQPDGTIYVTSRADQVGGMAGALHRVASDLSTVDSIHVASAQDVALFQGKAYVTSYAGLNSKISVVDLGPYAVSEEWTVADIGFARGSSEGYAGIDIDSKGRIWLTDHYYGGSSSLGWSDRLLVSSPIPAPGALALLGLSGLYAIRRRR